MNEATRSPAGDSRKTSHGATIAMVMVMVLAMIGGLTALFLFSK